VTDDDAPRFQSVMLAGYMDCMPAGHQFAVNPIFPRRAVTGLGGHGGSGKGVLVLTMLAHAANGAPFAGFHPDGELRCTYVTLEDEPERVRLRLRDITRAYKLDADLIERNLRLLDGTHLGPLACEESMNGTRVLRVSYLLDDLAKLTACDDLVVIDNASDAFDGDENSRRQVRTFVRALTEMANKSDAAVVLVAHIDKAAARGMAKGQSYSGSTAWHNSVRSRLALIEDGDDEVVMEHQKSNFTARAKPVRFRRDENGVLLPLSAKQAEQERQADSAAALRLMRAATAADIQVNRATTGPATAWHALRHLREAEPFGDDGRRLHAALGELSRQGHLEKATVRTAHRKDREVWRLTDAAEALAHFEGHRRTEPEAQRARANPPTPPYGAWARAVGQRAPAPLRQEIALARIGASAQMPSQVDNGACGYRAAKDGDQ